jgi:hypothetical protein
VTHQDGEISGGGLRGAGARRRRNLARLAAVLGLAFAATLAGARLQAAAPVAPPPAPLPADVQVTRIGDGPVIYPGMEGLEGELGDNINGPSVIRVPDWVKNPLGRYYMYFAHHKGRYIRLAYADRPEGPWKVYKPGTLHIEDTVAVEHLASPDVIVDPEHRRLLMYFHAPTEDPKVKRGRPYHQVTYVATSTDGIHFKADPHGFGAPYMRAFRYKGYVYGLGMSDKASLYPVWRRSGQFYRSRTGLPPFESGPRIIDEMRHAGLLVRGDTLHVFYTFVGDDPERIYHVQVDLRPDWTEWTASAPTEVLAPEKPYEGVDVAAAQSRGGMSMGRERALRDPAVLEDDGHVYLYYDVAGEKGIAVAEVKIPQPGGPAPRP